MANMRFNAPVAAFSLLVAMPSAFPAATAPGTNHDHSHGRAGAAKRVAPPQPRSAELDDQIAHLRAIRMRLSRAETPQARQALLLQRVVAHGLAASGRYMTLQVPLPDRPGQLARVSELLAIAGANVIEVLHTRHGQGLQISEVILQLSVETRGQEHRAHVISVLEEAGFRPRVAQD